MIAKILGITVQRVGQLHAQGVLPQQARGKWQLDACVQAYVGFKEQAARSERGSERDRLARAQAVKVEMENLRRRGELLPADMVFETLQQIAVWLNAQPLARASRLANECTNVAEPAVLRAKVVADGAIELADATALLEARAAALLAAPQDGGDSDAAEDEDADAMGGGEPGISAGEPGAGPVSRASDAVLHRDSSGMR